MSGVSCAIFDSTWKHHSHFTKCCRYAVMEQRQPLFLHPERQHADCSLDMGYMPPWACRCACAERSNLCCSMGPYLHTPCFTHGEPSLVHVGHLVPVVSTSPCWTSESLIWSGTQMGAVSSWRSANLSAVPQSYLPCLRKNLINLMILPKMNVWYHGMSSRA